VPNWNPGWKTKAVAVSAGGLMALLSFRNPEGYGLWGSITAAGAALIVPAVAFRELWSLGRFWVVLSFLGVLQVPLVILLQGMVERFRLPFMLLFGAIDCVFVISVIYKSCSESSSAGD
jgi:hypothetical protein